MELIKQAEIIRQAENEESADFQKVYDVLDISETTRQHYQRNGKLFYRHIKQNGANFNTFINYKRELEARRDFTPGTKNAYLTAARVWLKERHRCGALPADITANVKGFKQSRKHKRPGLNGLEIQEVLTAAANSGDFRERAILALLTFQGLRQIEISRLDITDLDLITGQALIHGKGKDDKEPVYLHPETVRALRGHLAAEGRKSGPVFISRDRARPGNRLTTRAIRGIIQRRLQELGINKAVHGFRHYFTTRLLEEFNGDLLKVAAYTRHASIEMLQVYDDRIKQAAELPKYYGAFDTLSTADNIQASANSN